MTAGPQDEPWIASPVSAEEAYYLRWAKETEKRNLEFANEVLRQMVTLDAALLAAGAALPAGTLLGWIHAPAMLLLLASLAASFWGILPFFGAVPYEPLAIKRHKEEALRWKRARLLAAAGCLLAAFAVAALGVVLRLFV